MITGLISTLGSRIRKLRLPPPHPDVRYVVIQQADNGFFPSMPAALVSRSDIKLVRCHRLGLSVSRNLGIQNVETEFCQIYDDDVEIDLQHMLSLPGLFRALGAQVITGSFMFSNGTSPKSYPNNAFQRNLISCGKVSSVEIAFDVGYVKKNSVLFDERFGLGAIYPTGEEFIFLANVIKSGGVVWYLPSSTCIHPPITSGLNFHTNDKAIVAKRKMFFEVFGAQGLLFTALFAVKKAPYIYRNGGNYFRFVKILFSG